MKKVFYLTHNYLINKDKKIKFKIPLASKDILCEQGEKTLRLKYITKF